MILRGIARTGRVLWDVWCLAAYTHVALIAGGVAFFAMFAIFPALAALIALFGLLTDPAVVTGQIFLMHDMLPDAAYDLIADQVTRLLTQRSDTLTLTTAVSVALALWSARAGVAALVQGLTAVHGAPQRGGFHHVFLAMLLTLSLIAVAVVALLAVVVSPIVLKLVRIEGSAAVALEVTRWGTALVAIVLALGILYRYGPNRQGRRFWLVTPGLVVVILLWVAASAGFSVYVNNFSSYNEVYGSIGAVIGLMMWLYISAYLVLLGAALDVVLLDPATARAILADGQAAYLAQREGGAVARPPLGSHRRS